MRHAPVALLFAGCATQPLVGVPTAAEPAACARTVVPGVAASALAVAPTPSGATIVWAEPGGVMRLEVSRDGVPAGAPQMTAPGAFDRAVAATIGERVVVGAAGGDTTQVFGAAFGIAPYRELALIGGLAGDSPVVTAGGVRLAPSVWYGGLLVAAFDESWIAHTAQLAVLTPASTELAATTAGDEAVIAWPAGDGCYVERVHDAANGTWWQESGACRAPHLASAGGGVALAFERADGVYLAVAASPAELHPASAQLVAAGAHAPRVIAFGGTYWLAYVDADGTAAAGFVDESGALHVTALEPASALELAVIGGAPRTLAVDAAGLTVTALCAE